MQKNKKQILCTRPVEASLMQFAESKDMVLDIVPFIETEEIQTIEVQQEIAQIALQFATVVFTSMNAVDAVTGMLDGHMPDWNIYCIGYRTKELIETYFGKQAITGTADSALELAELMIDDDHSDEVVFFCSNQRREELPEKLEEQGIHVNQITVYQTIALNHTIDKVYDGVLFFSPSAVKSFFTNNKLPVSTIVFTIGNTTQQSIREFCGNKIIVGTFPGKDKLVEQAIDYFMQ
jgi:uroporphyrinogen-III synthase